MTFPWAPPTRYSLCGWGGSRVRSWLLPKVFQENALAWLFIHSFPHILKFAEKLEDGYDDYGPETALVASTQGVGHRLRIPVELGDNVLASVRGSCDKSKHMISLDHPLSLELTPAATGGWNFVRDKMEREKNHGWPADQYNPTTRLSVTVRLYFAPNMAFPRNGRQPELPVLLGSHHPRHNAIPHQRKLR